MRHYDRTDGDYFLWNPDSTTDIYRVEETKVRCLSCPADENEYNDTRNDSAETSVTINKNGVSITNDTLINSKNNIKELKINRDGIIIKTN